MTIDQYIAQLKKLSKDMKNITAPLKIASYTVTAEMGERIFDNGLTTDGSTIGQYDTEPIYVSLSAVPKPKGVPTGKPYGKPIKAKSKFNDGRPHKSKYFAEGYKGYRANVGRQTSKVDLSMTGEMRMDFGNDKQMAEPRKISDEEYQIRFDKDINVKKREGIEEKYGEIFTLSEQERELFYTTMDFEFRARIAKK